MIANPFIDVSVIPMHGALQARVKWVVRDGFVEGTFNIFKSPDGLNNWKQIGSVSGRHVDFVDHDLITRGRLDEAYYLVKLNWRNQQFASNVISTFGRLSRSEFAAVRLIMKREWETLRRFTKAKFFKLRSDGQHCPRCTDPDTGQQIGIALCPICYGTSFEGGFYDPIDTFIQVGTISPKVQEDSREGVGSSDPVTVKARGTAYPIMEKNDMFVVPDTDKRYLIDVIEYGYYNGKVPVYAEIQLQMLARNDIRYQVPL